MSRVVLNPPQDSPAADGTRSAGWWHEAEEPGRTVCDVCPRGCALRPGDRGFCFVRENRGGQMVSTTYGRGTGFCVDPIEKKPLHHFYPGTAVLSFGTAGCNLGCEFCQNWSMSRSRDVAAAGEVAAPATIAAAARQLGCRSVAFTYNDPIVWTEYAIDTARECRAAGVKTVAVTSGHMRPDARKAFYDAMDAANVDLKAFSEEFYVQMTGGHLQPVLDTLRWIARESRTWLEITNLIIPQANDSPDELRRMCEWIAAELGPDVPLHFSAFHPDFNLTDRGRTPLETLLAAYELARAAGLRYVYTGNVSDRQRQATYCPGCGRAVIERDGYELAGFHLRDGDCEFCGTPIAGRFDPRPGSWGGRRRSVDIAAFAVPGSADVPSAENAGSADVPSAQSGRDARAPREATVPSQPAFSKAQEDAIFRAAGQQVAATVRLQRPDPIREALAETAAVPVYGAFVSLKRAGQLRSCCGFLGESILLGEALEHAAVRAAKDDPRFPPISAGELPQLDMEVWVLWGRQPMTARGEERTRAFTIGKHGLQVARGNCRGLLLPGVAVDHHLDAPGFLRQVCIKAGLAPDAWKLDDTHLMTFEGYAIRGRFPAEADESTGTGRGLAQGFAADSASSSETCAPSPSVRPPAVAGRFYPGRPEEIERMLDEMFPAAPQPEAWAGAMVPHAGWKYSGRLAAAVFSRVKIPPQVIVFCPRHHPGGAQWAVAPHARWALPGRAVESDLELAARLADGVAGLELDAAPHRQEHAIEVQLPLLARVAPHARVVGVTIGGGELASLLQFAAEMAAVLRDLSARPLLVISSDMNHFADDTATRQSDALALEAMQSLDPALLYRTVREERISMCGTLPAVLVMETLRQLGSLSRCELVGYATSAEASGDKHRVVGYAGVLLG